MIRTQVEAEKSTWVGLDCEMHLLKIQRYLGRAFAAESAQKGVPPSIFS